MESMSLFAQSEKPIGLASDHAGYEMKMYIISLFEEKGITYKDFGAYSTESSDYPDFAHQLAIAVQESECYPGISVCGTGNGMAMALNRHEGIRAAICWSEEISELARAHNDANILVIPGRFVSEEETYRILVKFLNTDFEGGRHKRRIDKISCR